MYYVEWALPDVDIDMIGSHEDKDNADAMTATEEADAVLVAPTRR